MTDSLDIELEEKSIRTCIINILTKKHPLKPKAIFEIIKAEHLKNATYPAVYKNLKILTGEKKLVKKNRDFSINIEWSRGLRKFSEEVEKQYTPEYAGLLNLDEFQENEIYTFKFKNLADADNYRKKLQLMFLKKGGIYPFCGMYYHLKTPIMIPDKALEVLSTTDSKKIKCYRIVVGDTPIDRWCAKFHMRSPLVFVKTGVKISSLKTCEIMILGDIIVQWHIPKHVQNYIDSLYTRAKGIDDINSYEFYEKIYTKPVDTKIVVISNRSMAECMRNQALSYFKKTG